MRAATSLKLLTLTLATSLLAPAQTTGWPHYGGDLGGTRYSTSSQITPANVQHLTPAWTFHTHALDTPRLGSDEASFEATPILFNRALYFTSPFDEVFALDALTGTKLWSYDPHALPLRKDALVTSRGVAAWQSPTPASTPCNARIFLGTLDARLLALDARTGQPCADFANHGAYDLRIGVNYQGFGGYSVTSPPTVVGNVVIVGSSVGDNQQVESESGLVRAFDALTGKLLWQWEPLPWAVNTHPKSGAGNVWSIISADPALGLVYLPTSSASPDYYGGLRPGDNRDSDSVVALEAATGKRIWAFQTVHHNVWDYDVPSEPVLLTYRNTPALAITTKQGEVFLLDRRTGTPLAPITEQPTPASHTPGEQTWPTQPISSVAALSPLAFPGIDNSTGWHRSEANANFCRDQLAKLRFDGIYTPPGTDASLLFPSNVGGVNWGGAAFDPTTNTLFANVNREVFRIQLIPRNGWYMFWFNNEPEIRDWPLWVIFGGCLLVFNLLYRFEHNRLRRTPHIARPYIPSLRGAILAMCVAAIAGIMCLFPMPPPNPHFGHELSPQRGAPYLILRDPIVDHDDHPCVAPPWGETVALNLATNTLSWHQPLGTLVAGEHTGSPIFGGPIVTATGLLFTAATNDAHLRALDSHTGAELWSARLPASARATPMTYTLDNRQFVVIAAGGHGGLTGTRGDSLVAFALQ